MGGSADAGESAPERTALAQDLENWMRQYQQSDSAAAARLIERVSPQIFHFFLNQVRDRSSAEDLLQDFWLRIHNTRHTYRPGEPVLPWLYAIARRAKIDAYRRSSRVTRHEVQTDVLPERPAHPTSEQAKTPDLAGVLQQLPLSQREVILLMKVNGLSLDETARATGTTIGAVKQKAHRAYQTLRKLLGRDV